MVAGYARLSRDDNKRNYCSIENQQLIVNNFCKANHIEVDEWYIDDNISGYLMEERPDFNKLLTKLRDGEIDIVVAKDLSRVGRSNEKMLELVNDIKAMGKRLIAIDDHFDTLNEEDDDTLGIKTWYNERIVKETSKKIKRVFKEKQKEGSLLTNAPFGYCIKKINRERKVVVVEEEAELIRRIFNMYTTGGMGHRAIAETLNAEGVKTPSQLMSERSDDVWQSFGAREDTNNCWQVEMVGAILRNDYYIGTFRQHKRERRVVHGKTIAIPKSENIVFYNHHEPIISQELFELAREMSGKRQAYKPFSPDINFTNIFHGVIYCSSCGGRLTPVKRLNKDGSIKRYYLCAAYSKFGKSVCSKSHIIDYKYLVSCINDYLKVCRDALQDTVLNLTVTEVIKNDEKEIKKKLAKSEQQVAKLKNRYKSLISQKVNELADNPTTKEIIVETYTALQKEVLSKIENEEAKIEEYNKQLALTTDQKREKGKNALEILDDILSHEKLSTHDVKTIIDKITVDESGVPYVDLKYGISDIIDCDITGILNRKQQNMINAMRELILKSESDFTSANYLSAKMQEMGYPITKNTISPLINFMLEEGIIQHSENRNKPYIIIKNQENISNVVRELVVKSDSDFTSVNSLLKKMQKMGYSIGRLPFMRYIDLLIKDGIIQPTGDKNKPYIIVKRC